MTQPTQTTLAAAGILHLRGILARVLYMPAHEYEALTALCDYAQAQIEARAKGGRTITDKRRAANRRNASKARKPQCACGKMTQERAAKRNHKCG